MQWTITSLDEGKGVREFLKEQNISKTALTDIKFKGGKIQVNEQEVTVRYSLKLNDVLKIEFPIEEASHGLVPENISLDIVYEDEYILVVNKPIEMNTIPSREHPSGSVANGVIYHFMNSGIQATAHIVTRLDRNTSGLVLVAKHRHVHHLLSMQQRKGRIKRVYEAIAEGTLEPMSGTIEEPIGRKEDSIIQREVRYDGQYALTHYQVLELFPYYTRLELSLETGRTHQIRVHLSYIGHPLAGDDLYGGSKKWINRQALHCKKVEFYHPFFKETLQFTADLPQDLENLIR